MVLPYNRFSQKFFIFSIIVVNIAGTFEFMKYILLIQTILFVTSFKLVIVLKSCEANQPQYDPYFFTHTNMTPRVSKYLLF